MQGVRDGLIRFRARGRHHAQAIPAVPGAELVANCTRLEANDSSAAAVDSVVPVVHTVGELPPRAAIDLCDVVPPPHWRFSVSAAVLQSGRQRLFEQSMNLSIDEGRRLIALVRKRNRVLALRHVIVDPVAAAKSLPQGMPVSLEDRHS